MCIVATGRFFVISRFLFPSKRRIPKEFRAVEGQIGRFRKNSSFLFPFAPVLQPVIGRKREQKSGNGRKTPKWQKKEQKNRSFPALQGYKFLKNRWKRPNHDPQASILRKPDLTYNSKNSPILFRWWDELPPSNDHQPSEGILLSLFHL